MQRVLIDACGWVACIDANLNIERDMEALIGPCTWVLLPSVETELIRLNEGRPKKKSLLLHLLRMRFQLFRLLVFLLLHAFGILCNQQAPS